MQGEDQSKAVAFRPLTAIRGRHLSASSGHDSPTVKEPSVARTPHLRTPKSRAALGSFFDQGRRAYALR